VFLINLPLGLLTLLALHWKVPESHPETAGSPIDYPGAILLMVGLAGLTYGLIALPELGFYDLRSSGICLGSLMILVICGIVEARSPHPMLPLALFQSRTFSGTNLLTLFLYAAFSVGPFFLCLNLVEAQGYRPAIAGLADLPFALMLAGLSPWAGGLTDRYGARLPLMIGPALTGLGFLLLALVGLTHGAADYWKTFFPGIVVFGLGMAVTVAPLTTAVMGSVPPLYAGTASGVNNAVARTAGVLAIAIVGAIAICTFTGALTTHTASLHLTTEVQNVLQAGAHRFDSAIALPNLTPAATTAVETAVKLAFVDTFRVVMLICASLAGLSALMAAWLVDR
jgi:MFS family permease